MHRLWVGLLELGRSSKAHRIRDGANVVDAESVRVTLSMTAAEREALREIAKARGTTVSGLIQSLIDERCGASPSIGDGRVRLNVRQRMDGLTMLGHLGDELAACAFFDPQYRGLLDRLDYGNEGVRQRGRAALEHGEETVRVTVTMTRGQRRALKRLARDAGTSASAIIRKWARRDGEASGTGAISKDPSTDGRGRAVG